MRTAHIPEDYSFADRQEAGLRLAAELGRYADDDVVVLALPRGGVPVGYEVARALHAPLDVMFVRKLGAPGFLELGLGAVVDGENPQRILNQRVIEAVDPPPGYIEAEERRQLEIIAQRKLTYRGDRPPVPVAGRTVILVDDGIATGGTVRVALQALKRSGVARTVLAVPVAPAEVARQLRQEVDAMVCLLAPVGFEAVGAYYVDFSQTSEAEVIHLLSRAAQRFADDTGTSGR